VVFVRGSGLTTVLFALLAICFLPSAFILFVVREKEIRAKQQQVPNAQLLYAAPNHRYGHALIAARYSRRLSNRRYSRGQGHQDDDSDPLCALQVVSGVSFIAYWTSTWLFDLISYQVRRTACSPNGDPGSAPIPCCGNGWRGVPLSLSVASIMFDTSPAFEHVVVGC
jgi:hypothetical protein